MDSLCVLRTNAKLEGRVLRLCTSSGIEGLGMRLVTGLVSLVSLVA